MIFEPTRVRHEFSVPYIITPDSDNMSAAFLHNCPAVQHNQVKNPEVKDMPCNILLMRDLRYETQVSGRTSTVRFLLQYL